MVDFLEVVAVAQEECVPEQDSLLHRGLLIRLRLALAVADQLRLGIKDQVAVLLRLAPSRALAAVVEDHQALKTAQMAALAVVATAGQHLQTESVAQEILLPFFHHKEVTVATAEVGQVTALAVVAVLLL